MFDPVTVIAALALAAAVLLAVRHLVKSKQRGIKCVGCPLAAACSGKTLLQLQPYEARKGDPDASYCK